MKKIRPQHLVRVFLIENFSLNCFKEDRIQDYDKSLYIYIYIFFREKYIQQVRRLEALQRADAQSTGLW